MPPPAIRRWLEIADARDPAGLEALLADDVVFLSPVVHRPQRGRAITVKYLAAALDALGGASFRYGEHWIGPTSAVLAFEAILDGVEVDGADFIGWNAQDRIDRFKVMVRPLKAIQAVQQAMAARLAG
jgi:hypothetical protein